MLKVLNWEPQCPTLAIDTDWGGQYLGSDGTSVPSSDQCLNPKENAAPSSGQRLTLPCTAAPTSSASEQRLARDGETFRSEFEGWRGEK